EQLRDVLTAIYYLRQNAAAIKTPIKTNIYSDGKSYPVMLRPVERRSFKMQGASVDALGFEIVDAPGGRKWPGGGRVWLSEVEQFGHVERFLHDHGRFQLVFIGIDFVRRDDDDRRIAPQAAEPAKPLAAVHARHHQIENDELNVGILLHQRNGVLSIRSGENFEAVWREQVAVGHQQLRIVIDDQKLAGLEGYSAGPDAHRHLLILNRPTVMGKLQSAYRLARLAKRRNDVGGNGRHGRPIALEKSKARRIEAQRNQAPFVNGSVTGKGHVQS